MDVEDACRRRTGNGNDLADLTTTGPARLQPVEAAICFSTCQHPGYLPKSQNVVLIDHTIGSDYLQKEGWAGVILVLLFLM